MQTFILFLDLADIKQPALRHGDICNSTLGPQEHRVEARSD